MFSDESEWSAAATRPRATKTYGRRKPFTSIAKPDIFWDETIDTVPASDPGTEDAPNVKEKKERRRKEKKDKVGITENAAKRLLSPVKKRLEGIQSTPARKPLPLAALDGRPLSSRVKILEDKENDNAISPKKSRRRVPERLILQPSTKTNIIITCHEAPDNKPMKIEQEIEQPPPTAGLIDALNLDLASLTLTPPAPVSAAIGDASPTLPLTPEPAPAEPLPITLDTLLTFTASTCITPFETYLDELCASNVLTKLGEASFSEVFLASGSATTDKTVLKVIPFGKDDEGQCTIGDIIQEVRLSSVMSSLPGFVPFRGVSVCQGIYPARFLEQWDAWAESHGTENERPAYFADDQMFAVITLTHGGTDLEHATLKSWQQAAGVFWDCAEILGRGEKEKEFEHRDLHWGNILLQDEDEGVAELLEKLTVDDAVPAKVTIPRTKVTLIDYTLSRAKCDDSIGAIAYNAMTDEEVFTAKGEYQYDIYRFMRATVLSRSEDPDAPTWSEFHSKTNVHWLHYIADKLLYHKGLTRPSTRPSRTRRSDSSLLNENLDMEDEKKAYDSLEAAWKAINPRKKKLNGGAALFDSAGDVRRWGEEQGFC
ncbi:hypothetical protein SAICODRAFT_30009 [Saitoella complicata NRRL Y-17804]|nr:uncharacterized protein SAICODRAFT_30009 [Saitoella complicata NRRL Y-17804]ODQ53659.1 hypothetical protein SAICODRAFT_30009 [Saitoella complicata NRRL Y-17804]